MLVATRPIARRGLGSQQTAMQGVQYGSIGASTAAAGALAAGLIPAAAVPFIGPAIAGAALLASYLIKNSGCGQTCIQTSQWANQAADALQKNLDAYRALPVPRSRANQTLALQTFDQIWSKLVSMCSDPQWGDAGKACVSDRQQGACKWRDSSGQCWNWFVGYRDPIANDPNVIDDSVVSQVSDIFGGAQSGSTSSVLPLALIAGLVIAGVMA